MARINKDLLEYKSIYEDDGVLKNKLGITNRDELNAIESYLSTYKLSKLYLDPGDQTFDINHYLSIHEYIFGDIYDFAGCIRSECINKKIPFCLPQYIYSNLKYVLEEMRKKAGKVNSREELVDFVTYYYSELDIIHPFREGNGRCEREYLRQFVDYLCYKKGLDYCIDYTLLDDKIAFIDALVDADCLRGYDALRGYIDKMIVSSRSLKR